MLHFAPIWDFAWIPFVPVLPSEFSEALSAGEVVAKNMYNIGQLTKTVNEIVVKLQNLTGVPGVFSVSRVKEVPGGDTPYQQRVFEKGGASGIWVTNLTEVELVRAWIKDDNNNNHLFADSAGKTIENGLIFVVDQKDDDWQFMILTTDGKLYTTKGKYSEMPNDESKVKMTDVPDLTQLKADVETLKPEMATAKQDITKLKSDMSTAKQDITGLKSDISTAKQDITGLKSDMSTAKQDITKLKSDVTSANQNITSLQTTVQNIQQTGGDVSGLTQSLNSLTSTVAQHTADLEGIKKNTLDKITRWTNLTEKFRDSGVVVHNKEDGDKATKGVFIATTGEVFNGTDYHSFEYNLALPIRSTDTIKVVAGNGDGDTFTPAPDTTLAKYIGFELNTDVVTSFITKSQIYSEPKAPEHPTNRLVWQLAKQYSDGSAEVFMRFKYESGTSLVAAFDPPYWDNSANYPVFEEIYGIFGNYEKSTAQTGNVEGFTVYNVNDTGGKPSTIRVAGTLGSSGSVGGIYVSVHIIGKAKT